MRIVGINSVGSVSGNEFVTAGRTLPWLQDVFRDPVWTAWAPTYRDVVILDAQNRVAAVFNLTEHDLQTQGEYDALKALLLSVAGE